MHENSTNPNVSRDVIYIVQENSAKKVWTFAGGKGGTGKTAVTANIGVALATMGYKVILVDADLGGANLHTILNIKRPDCSLADFLNHRYNTLEDILLPTPSQNLRLISGGSDMVGLANISYQAKVRLQKHLELLEADYILIDLGAGTSFNTLDFFVLSNEGFLITNPEPTAKINAYSFLKSVVYRLIEREFKRGTGIGDMIMQESRNNKSGNLSIPELIKRIASIDSVSSDAILDILARFRPKLIMNKLRRYSQEKEGLQLSGLTEKYLGVSMEYLGMVREDSHVVDSSELMMPFVLQFPGSGAAKDIYTIVGKLGVKDSLDRFETDKTSKLKKYMRSERNYWYQE